MIKCITHIHHTSSSLVFNYRFNPHIPKVSVYNMYCAMQRTEHFLSCCTFFVLVNFIIINIYYYAFNQHTIGIIILDFVLLLLLLFYRLAYLSRNSHFGRHHKRNVPRSFHTPNKFYR